MKTLGKHLIIFNIAMSLCFLAWIAYIYYESPYILFLMFIFGVMNFIFFLFIISKRSILFAIISIFVWGVITVTVSNVLLSCKASIWTGFEYHRLLGWYSLANLRKINFGSSPESKYIVSTDKYGHRNHLSYDSELEFMVQGDSNLFGFELSYEDTLCYKLNTLTNEKFYNFGVPGFDINQYYFQYKFFSDKFSIKNRIIFFNIGNDFSASLLATPYLIRRPYLQSKEGIIEEHINNIGTVKKQVYGYKFIDIYKNYDSSLKFLNAGRDWGDRCPKWVQYNPVLLFLEEKLSQGLFKLTSLFYQKKKKADAQFLNPYYPGWLLLKRELWPQPYQDYSVRFEEIIAFLKVQNKNLYICLFPMRSQVIDEDFRLAVRDLLNRGYKEEDIDRYSFNRYFSDICKRNKIELIDLTLGLVRQSSSSQLFQEGNFHLNAKGIDICADLLIQELSKNN